MGQGQIQKRNSIFMKAVSWILVFTFLFSNSLFAEVLTERTHTLVPFYATSDKKDIEEVSDGVRWSPAAGETLRDRSQRLREDFNTAIAAVAARKLEKSLGTQDDSDPVGKDEALDDLRYKLDLARRIDGNSPVRVAALNNISSRLAHNINTGAPLQDSSSGDLLRGAIDKAIEDSKNASRDTAAPLFKTSKPGNQQTYQPIFRRSPSGEGIADSAKGKADSVQRQSPTSAASGMPARAKTGYVTVNLSSSADPKEKGYWGNMSLIQRLRAIPNALLHEGLHAAADLFRGEIDLKKGRYIHKAPNASLHDIFITLAAPVGGILIPAFALWKSAKDIMAAGYPAGSLLYFSVLVFTTYIVGNYAKNFIIAGHKGIVSGRQNIYALRPGAAFAIGGFYAVTTAVVSGVAIYKLLHEWPALLIGMMLVLTTFEIDFIVSGFYNLFSHTITADGPRARNKLRIRRYAKEAREIYLNVDRSFVDMIEARGETFHGRAGDILNSIYTAEDDETIYGMFAERFTGAEEMEQVKRFVVFARAWETNPNARRLNELLGRFTAIELLYKILNEENGEILEQKITGSRNPHMGEDQKPYYDLACGFIPLFCFQKLLRDREYVFVDNNPFEVAHLDEMKRLLRIPDNVKIRESEISGMDDVAPESLGTLRLGSLGGEVDIDSLPYERFAGWMAPGGQIIVEYFAAETRGLSKNIEIVDRLRSVIGEGRQNEWSYTRGYYDADDEFHEFVAGPITDELAFSTVHIFTRSPEAGPPAVLPDGPRHTAPDTPRRSPSADTHDESRQAPSVVHQRIFEEELVWLIQHDTPGSNKKIERTEEIRQQRIRRYRPVFDFLMDTARLSIQDLRRYRELFRSDPDIKWDFLTGNPSEVIEVDGVRYPKLGIQPKKIRQELVLLILSIPDNLYPTWDYLTGDPPETIEIDGIRYPKLGMAPERIRGAPRILLANVRSSLYPTWAFLVNQARMNRGRISQRVLMYSLDGKRRTPCSGTRMRVAYFTIHGIRYRERPSILTASRLELRNEYHIDINDLEKFWRDIWMPREDMLHDIQNAVASGIPGDQVDTKALSDAFRTLRVLSDDHLYYTGQRDPLSAHITSTIAPYLEHIQDSQHREQARTFLGNLQELPTHVQPETAVGDPRRSPSADKSDPRVYGERGAESVAHIVSYRPQEVASPEVMFISGAYTCTGIAVFDPKTGRYIGFHEFNFRSRDVSRIVEELNRRSVDISTARFLFFGNSPGKNEITTLKEKSLKKDGSLNEEMFREARQAYLREIARSRAAILRCLAEKGVTEDRVTMLMTDLDDPNAEGMNHEAVVDAATGMILVYRNETEPNTRFGEKDSIKHPPEVVTLDESVSFDAAARDAGIADLERIINLYLAKISVLNKNHDDDGHETPRGPSTGSGRESPSGGRKNLDEVYLTDARSRIDRYLEVAKSACADQEEGEWLLPEYVVSNEAYPTVMPHLERALQEGKIKQGGIYAGVGFEQNLSFIGALKPARAVIIERNHSITKVILPVFLEYISRFSSREALIDELMREWNGRVRRDLWTIARESLPEELRHRAWQMWGADSDCAAYIQRLIDPATFLLWQMPGCWLSNDSSFETVKTMWLEGKLSAVSGNWEGETPKKVAELVGEPADYMYLSNIFRFNAKNNPDLFPKIASDLSNNLRVLARTGDPVILEVGNSGRNDILERPLSSNFRVRTPDGVEHDISQAWHDSRRSERPVIVRRLSVSFYDFFADVEKDEAAKARTPAYGANGEPFYFSEFIAMHSLLGSIGNICIYAPERSSLEDDPVSLDILYDLRSAFDSKRSIVPLSVTGMMKSHIARHLRKAQRSALPEHRGVYEMFIERMEREGIIARVPEAAPDYRDSLDSRRASPTADDEASRKPSAGKPELLPAMFGIFAGNYRSVMSDEELENADLFTRMRLVNEMLRDIGAEYVITPRARLGFHLLTSLADNPILKGFRANLETAITDIRPEQTKEDVSRKLASSMSRSPDLSEQGFGALFVEIALGIMPRLTGQRVAWGIFSGRQELLFANTPEEILWRDLYRAARFQVFGNSLQDPEILYDFMRPQWEALEKKSQDPNLPLELSPGYLYIGREQGLFEAAAAGEVGPEHNDKIELARLGHIWANPFGRGMRSEDPAVYVLPAERFNELARQEKASIKIVKVDLGKSKRHPHPYLRIAGNLAIDEFVEIWVSQDTYDRCREMMRSGGANERLARLMDAGTIKAIPGFRHESLGTGDDTRLAGRVAIGSYMEERGLFYNIPLFREAASMRHSPTADTLETIERTTKVLIGGQPEDMRGLTVAVPDNLKERIIAAAGSLKHFDPLYFSHVLHHEPGLTGISTPIDHLFVRAAAAYSLSAVILTSPDPPALYRHFYAVVESVMGTVRNGGEWIGRLQTADAHDVLLRPPFESLGEFKRTVDHDDIELGIQHYPHPSTWETRQTYGRDSFVTGMGIEELKNGAESVFNRRIFLSIYEDREKETVWDFEDEEHARFIELLERIGIIGGNGIVAVVKGDNNEGPAHLLPLLWYWGHTHGRLPFGEGNIFNPTEQDKRMVQEIGAFYRALPWHHAARRSGYSLTDDPVRRSPSAERGKAIWKAMKGNETRAGDSAVEPFVVDWEARPGRVVRRPSTGSGRGSPSGSDEKPTAGEPGKNRTVPISDICDGSGTIEELQNLAEGLLAEPKNLGTVIEELTETYISRDPMSRAKMRAFLYVLAETYGTFRQKKSVRIPSDYIKTLIPLAEDLLKKDIESDRRVVVAANEDMTALRKLYKELKPRNRLNYYSIMKSAIENGFDLSIQRVIGDRAIVDKEIIDDGKGGYNEKEKWIAMNEDIRVPESQARDFVDKLKRFAEDTSNKLFHRFRAYMILYAVFLEETEVDEKTGETRLVRHVETALAPDNDRARAYFEKALGPEGVQAKAIQELLNETLRSELRNILSERIRRRIEERGLALTIDEYIDRMLSPKTLNDYVQSVPESLRNKRITVKSGVRGMLYSAVGNDHVNLALQMGARLTNVSMKVRNKYTAGKYELPVGTSVQVIDSPVVRLHSLTAGYKGTVEITSLSDIYDYSEDRRFTLHKTCLVTSGIIPESLKGDPAITLRDILERFTGAGGRGIEISIDVKGVPPQSGLGASSSIATNTLAALAKFSGQSRSDDTDLPFDEIMLLVARTLYEEQINEALGGWQDACSMLPGIKLLSTEPGQFLPSYKRLTGRAQKKIEKLVKYVRGGLERAAVSGSAWQFTGLYALRLEPIVKGRIRARQIVNEQMALIEKGKIADLDTREEENNRIWAIVAPAAYNEYFRMLKERLIRRLGKGSFVFGACGSTYGAGNKVIIGNPKATVPKGQPNEGRNILDVFDETFVEVAKSVQSRMKRDTRFSQYKFSDIPPFVYDYTIADKAFEMEIKDPVSAKQSSSRSSPSGDISRQSPVTSHPGGKDRLQEIDRTPLTVDRKPKESIDPGLVADDIARTTRDLEVHQMLNPDDAKDLSTFTVIAVKGLTDKAGEGKEADLNYILWREYKEMAQDVERLIEKDIVEIVPGKTTQESAKRLSDAIEDIKKSDPNTRVIILDDGSLTGELSEGDITAGTEGKDFCVISTKLGKHPKNTIDFVNLEMMTIMGVGVLSGDMEIFDLAYRVFNGEAAPAELLRRIKERKDELWWIVNVIPRAVRFDKNYHRNQVELAKLFAVAA
ncbi:MAG: hypothetical protein ABIJ27_01295 [Candidatus Omnitrophota bacterium]